MGKDAVRAIQNIIADRDWGLEFTEEARSDLKKFEASGLLEIILGAIFEGHKNPLPKVDGGTGDLLGKHPKTGDGRPALYWKLRGCGIRIIYGLEPPSIQNNQEIKKKNVLILVIGPREEEEAYNRATGRLPKYRERLWDHLKFKNV